MKKIISFMHVSLDGLVAGPNGEMDWIHVDDEIFDYAGQMTSQSDLALYGRKTWEMMEGYWPTAADQPNPSKHDIEHSAWYKKVSKVVLSRTLKGRTINNTQIISDNVPEEIMKIKQRGGKYVVVFGSPGADHTLMQHDLIDEYWLFINPVIVGTGTPMFKNIRDKQSLKLLETKRFSSGVVAVHYERTR